MIARTALGICLTLARVGWFVAFVLAAGYLILAVTP